ncbi:MAG TPA: AAA family ATPase [Thermoflexia bacterium]|nr:AAA family ATPase [Thermoflexia bacterium]
MPLSSTQPAIVNTSTVSEVEAARLLHYQPDLPQRLSHLLSTVTTYLPHGLSHALMETPSLKTLALPIEGTVMFADVDGFTAMTERLSKLAATEGAEELTRLVNRFLAILITHTLPYGGDLQKFGGDAGLLLFTGEEHALRATSAALAVHRAVDEQLAEVETSLGAFPLRIATGLASGRMVGIGLGTAENRKWMLTGPPLTAMGLAQERAPSGGIVVDRSLLFYCGEQVTSIPLTERLYLVAADQELPLEEQLSELPHPPAKLAGLPLAAWLLERLDALTPYLDPEFLTRIITLSSLEHFEFWHEHRQVTILMLGMASLPELTAYWNHPAALQRLVERPNEIFGRARDYIQRYGGAVNKIGMGPQGPYLMALFGAPQAHEDDPLRATLAALRMQEHSEVPLRVGINSGFVFAGDVGTAERREYTVMGDAVNLAYRLKSSCEPGQVWLGPHTARHPAIRQRISGVVGPPQQLKGKSQPVTPYIAQAMRSATEWTAVEGLPLIGRAEELGELQAALARCATRTQTEIVLLHGVAGMGKSRLAAELSRWALGQGFQVHSGSAPSYGMHLPHAAWKGLLLSLLGLDALPVAKQPAALHHLLAALGLDIWAALIAPLIDLEVVPSPEVASLSPELREMERLIVLTALLEAAASVQPQLLILENVHWMPPASRQLLAGVLENLPAASFTLVLTYRDDEEFLSSWEPLERATEIPLPPLSRLAMAKLAAQAAGGTLPREIKRWIAKRGAGTPLFAIESIEVLKMAGILQLQRGEWELTQSLDEAPLPETAYGLIQSRIDRLEPPSRHLLRSATVVGEQMTVPMLVAGYGEEPQPVVRRRLPTLNPFGLVYGDQAEETLFFQQPLTREVAYHGLPYRIRRLVHSRLSGYLDDARAAATSNWLTLLAFHSFEGQCWEVAVRANLDLGKHALDNYLTEQAAEAFGQALQAIEAGQLQEAEECFEVHHLLGETLTIIGDYDRALEHFEEARGMLPSKPTKLEAIRQLAHLEYRVATVLETQGHYALAFEAVKRGLDLPEVKQTLEGAQLYLIGAGLFQRQGEHQLEEEWCSRSAKLAQSFQGVEAEKIQARSFYMRAYLSAQQGDPQRALKLGKKSLEIYQRLQDILGEMNTRNNLLLINMKLGHWQAATRHGEYALALARRIHDSEGEAKLTANLGELYRYQGRLKEARQAYETTLAITQRLGIKYGEALMENNLAATAIQEGKWQEAAQRLREAESILQQLGSKGALSEIYRHRAELHIGQQENQRALTWGKKSLACAEEQGLEEGIGYAHLMIAKVYLSLEKRAAADNHLAQAAGVLQKIQDLYGMAQILVTQAEYHRQYDTLQQANSKLREALVQFEMLGATRDIQMAQRLAQHWEIELESAPSAPNCP